MASVDQSTPGFWNGRTGWTLLKQTLFLEPLPGGSRWAAAFGSLLLFSFVLQVVTGVLLSMNYAPSVETAWASVNFLQEDVPLGSFIRALHHWGSSAMIVLLLLHLMQVFVWGAYKKPREFTWMVGVLLLFCVLGLSFTGYLLPWDQKAYWATKVGLGIVSTTPEIGDSLRTLLQGGPEIGNLTLTRFFSIHTFILPGLVILLVVVHLYLFRVHGVTPPWWVSAKQLKVQEEPFWPKQALKDGVLALAFLVGLGIWAYYRPAPLAPEADPAQPYEARPEWYFMFLFQLLRYFHGPYEIVGTFVLPLLFFLIMFFWPFLDRNPERDPRRRPIAMGLFTLATVGLVGLTIFAVATDVRMKEPEQAAPPERSAEPAGPIQRADVAKLYNTHCAACHGVDGSAGAIRAAMPTIPDFTSLSWQMSQTELEITHRIHDGNEPLMPAYRDKLSSQQILALAVYVRAFASVHEPVTSVAPSPGGERPKPAVAPAPSPVAAPMTPIQVYRAYCLACHDSDGRGRTVRAAMPEMPDFTDAKWQTSRTDADFKKAVLEGKGKFMPALKSKLSAADADQAVAYVRGFSGAKQVASIEPPKLPTPPISTGPVTESGPRPTPQPSPLTKPRTPAPAVSAQELAERTRVATGLYRQYCLVCHGSDGKGQEIKAAMPTIPDFSSRSWHDSVSDAQLMAGILEGKGTLMPPFRGRVAEEQARDLVAYIRAFAGSRAAPAPAPAAADTDFEKRFRELQDQWNELQRQLQELNKPPRKP
jgi:ubiquinol-cytochrome c reductase cytochrome b subunit